jgi:hypothetical protein
MNFEVVGFVSSSEVEDSLETSRNEPIGQSRHPNRSKGWSHDEKSNSHSK